MVGQFRTTSIGRLLSLVLGIRRWLYTDYTQAAFRTGSIFEACADLLQTGDAYSAAEARAVVRIVLASVPQVVFVNFLRMLFLATEFLAPPGLCLGTASI